MSITILMGIAGACLIGATFIFASRENTGVQEFAGEVRTLRGDMKLYATKDDVANVGSLASQAVAKAAVSNDECVALDQRMNKAEGDFTELKTRVESMQMQVNKYVGQVKALPPKVVHVKHTYNSPMQVELYPEKVMKAKGRGKASLLERAGAR